MKTGFCENRPHWRFAFTKAENQKLKQIEAFRESETELLPTEAEIQFVGFNSVWRERFLVFLSCKSPFCLEIVFFSNFEDEQGLKYFSFWPKSMTYFLFLQDTCQKTF